MTTVLVSPTLGASNVKAVTGMRSPFCLSPRRPTLDQARSKAHMHASAPPRLWPAVRSGRLQFHCSGAMAAGLQQLQQLLCL